MPIDPEQPPGRRRVIVAVSLGCLSIHPCRLGAGLPVTSVLTTAASDKYVSYSSLTGAEMTEARARGVSEAFYRARVVDTHRRPELLSCIKAAKRAPGCLFFPVDGMFAPGPTSRSVEISFAGYPLRVRANPASLASSLQIPIVVVFAARENPGRITIAWRTNEFGPAYVRDNPAHTRRSRTH
jgi:hypothetical protein